MPSSFPTRSACLTAPISVFFEHEIRSAAMQQVADFGVLVVSCRGDWCSLASSTTRMDLDLERLWPVVRQLVTS